MDSEFFVRRIEQYVRNAAIADTIEDLEKPAGRRPRSAALAISAWYNNLSNIDKSKVKAVATAAAHQAVFGFLAVLDGARLLEDGAKRGRFELIYVGDKRILLNEPNAIDLHDLLGELDFSGIQDNIS